MWSRSGHVLDQNSDNFLSSNIKKKSPKTNADLAEMLIFACVSKTTVLEDY
jgi:hypothetical protein